MAHIGQGPFFGGSRDVRIDKSTFVNVENGDYYQVQSGDRGGLSPFTEIHLSL